MFSPLAGKAEKLTKIIHGMLLPSPVCHVCLFSLSLSLCVSLVTKSWCFSGMIIPQEIARRAWDRKRGRGSVRSSPAFLVDLDFLDASDLSFFSDLSWPGNSSNSGTHREPLKNNTTINAEESNQKKKKISRKESCHIISTLPVIARE